VTGAENEALCVPVSEQEFEAVVRSLPSSKVLGMDGFLATFFHSYWSIVCGDICYVVQFFLVLGTYLLLERLLTSLLLQRFRTQ